MIPSTTDDIKKLHAQYCALTGLQVPFTTQSIFMWENWLFCGFSEPDLACVVRYLKLKIKEGKRPKESLLPRNLIQRTDFFGEDLAIARAESRNKPSNSPKAEILRAAGYVEPEKQTVRPAGDVLAAAKALDDLRKWRIENNL